MIPMLHFLAPFERNVSFASCLKEGSISTGPSRVTSPSRDTSTHDLTSWKTLQQRRTSKLSHLLRSRQLL
jgi:hypothetical protein